MTLSHLPLVVNITCVLRLEQTFDYSTCHTSQSIRYRGEGERERNVCYSFHHKLNIMSPNMEFTNNEGVIYIYYVCVN